MAEPAVMTQWSRLLNAAWVRPLLFLVLIVVAWAASGPFFHFSDTWQLVINTTTTIITFLMVFLIQRAQNKDAQAAALKLNELIAALEGASNRLINAESLPEDDLRTLHLHFEKLVKLAERDASLTKSHSVEEAELRHKSKSAPRSSKITAAPR